MPTIAKKTVLPSVLLCTAALGACAVLPGAAMATETLTGATAAPIAGESTPATSPQSPPSLQEGVALATWFGPGLFGRHTACGQLLTKQLVGVANRTLPCGTLVDFSYRGRQVSAPVVDRGPYGSIGANWDLTYGAARLLKMGGTAKVNAKIVGHLQNSPELGQPAGQSASRKKSSAVTSPTGGVQAG